MCLFLLRQVCMLNDRSEGASARVRQHFWSFHVEKPLRAGHVVFFFDFKGLGRSL